MILYHASHEQFAPSSLLKFAVMAEQAGFEGIHSSDHFHPWSERQGQSGFTFSWLGAAMQATKLPCGMICAPGQRYHPAIIAQAAATLSEMFPGRFWLELGSGEAINECITGEGWPPKIVRNERLLECVAIIRKLLKGEPVTHKGLVAIEDARLYTLPSEELPIIGAAITSGTAAFVGSWADGLLTVNKPDDELVDIITAFRKNGGNGKPMYLKVQLSYARDDEQALNDAHDQWRNNVLPAEQSSELRSVADFDAAGTTITPEDVRRHVLISSSMEQHIDWLKNYKSMGIDHLILHHVGRDQETFINDFGTHVLPILK